MTRQRRPRSCAVVVVCVLALVSCSRSSDRAGSPATGSGSATGREVLVTIGSGATFGVGLKIPLRDAWPQKLYHESFPRSTVLINVADQAMTIARAGGQPLSIALSQHATVVAIWLGDLDLFLGVDPATFEAQLRTLVGKLTASGARVLLGNLPRTGPGSVAFDDAIARLADGPDAAGVTLVDVAAALSATPSIGPSHEMDVAMSEKIARAFGAALAPA